MEEDAQLAHVHRSLYPYRMHTHTHTHTHTHSHLRTASHHDRRPLFTVSSGPSRAHQTQRPLLTLLPPLPLLFPAPAFHSSPSCPLRLSLPVYLCPFPFRSRLFFLPCCECRPLLTPPLPAVPSAPPPISRAWTTPRPSPPQALSRPSVTTPSPSHSRPLPQPPPHLCSPVVRTRCVWLWLCALLLCVDTGWSPAGSCTSVAQPRPLPYAACDSSVLHCSVCSVCSSALHLVHCPPLLASQRLRSVDSFTLPHSHVRCGGIADLACVLRLCLSLTLSLRLLSPCVCRLPSRSRRWCAVI